jgi:hypothetical protein
MKTQSDVKNRFVIIMAGGCGGRFWPVNRQKTIFGLEAAAKKVYPSA